MQSPITKTYPTNPGAALTLADESTTYKTLVRAAAGTSARGSLAVAYGSSSNTGEVLTAGSRPDEWILIGSADAVRSRIGVLDTSGHVSVVDWTHGRAMFRLSGVRAGDALSKVCSIDLSDSMTPNGAVVSASVAKVGCDLIRNDMNGAKSFLLLCDRSFAQYLFDALIDTCNEFGVDAVT